jgi:hypothetical protein
LRLLRIFANGSTVQTIDWQQIAACPAGNTRMSCGGALVHLEVGEYIEVYAYFYFTGAGGTLKVKNDGGFSPVLGLHWVSD